MTSWAEVFLGIIALATLTMAAVQVAAIAYGWRVSRQVTHQLARIEQDLKHLLDSFNAVARDAARISAMAASQAERADRLLTDLATRVEAAIATCRETVLNPVRQGTATLAGVRAVFDFLRTIISRSRARSGRSESEEALFIG